MYTVLFRVRANAAAQVAPGTEVYPYTEDGYAFAQQYGGRFVGRALTFPTKEEAEEFAATWQMGPWWYVPTGKHRVVKVVQQFRQVPDGFRLEE
ncbi:MAG TPA: hypothetical protein VM783_17895 [Candidatus Acidoferrum sp.]|nr:hypothetical protein [Candidatus Acidoferrum sp.]